MKVSNIRELVNAPLRVSPVSSLARTAILQRLACLGSGRVLVNEGDESFVFGQSAEDAKVTARIIVQDSRVYRLIAEKGMLGFAEAYVHGMWVTHDLVAVIRVLAMNIDKAKMLDTQSWSSRLVARIFSMMHSNNVSGSKRNISAHYDLGNDFFSLFLDSSMMYSSAIFEYEQQSLEAAARYKLQRICEKLDLQPSDSVIEIGTGWGGFACFAAQQYGCKVTTTTISQEQYSMAVERVKLQGLQDKVTVLLQDYRLLQGKYDKLVSIEMIEAVGHEYYADYFAKCSSLLKPEGQMLIQSILVSDQRYDFARKNTDFIKRYIFPGGCLPSIQVISDHIATATDMQIMHIDDITYDYAKTLAAWRERFLQKLASVRLQGFSEEFIRLWEFYLCYCQAGFMERTIHTAQIVFAKPQWRDARYPHE